LNNVILDASAVLTLLNAETGADKVASFIPGAVINTVNLSEVIAKLSENGMPEKAISKAIRMLGLKVVVFDEKTAYNAGMIRKETKYKGLSFGDRACLASGILMNLPVITADRNWQEIHLPVEIRVIR